MSELELERMAMGIAYGYWIGSSNREAVGYWEMYERKREEFLRLAREHRKLVADSRKIINARYSDGGDDD